MNGENGEATTDGDESTVTAESDKVRAPQGRLIEVGHGGLFALDAGPNKGQLRPAVVVKVNEDETVNIQVMTDGEGDGHSGSDGLPNVYYRANVPATEIQT